MKLIQTPKRAPKYRRTVFLTGVVLAILSLQNKSYDQNGISGLWDVLPPPSYSFLPDIVVVHGFVPSMLNMNSRHDHHLHSYSRFETKTVRTYTTEQNADTTMLLLDSDADANNNTSLVDSTQIMETLWSYVNNLQRARNSHGEMKAVYSFARYLRSNRYGGKQFEYSEDDGESHNNSNISLTEALERTLIQAIRQAGESNDYNIILRLISGSIIFANNHPILTPRIFGEALAAMSKTMANASKVKSIWNTMIGDPRNDSLPDIRINEVDGAPLPSFLKSPPTAFELNTYIKSMASLGKSKACIDVYRSHCARELRGSKMHLSDIYIQPDAYTISILLSILTNSISRDQKMCDPVDFPMMKRKMMPKDMRNMEPDEGIFSAPESLLSKMEMLTYSTCWQWNTAIELLGTLPDDDHGASESGQRQIQWRTNHVYSALLKLQDKAQDLCNKSTNSPRCHKNGSELTMSILDDMIRHEVIPDAVTCTLAINAMGLAIASANNPPSGKSRTNALYDKNGDNLAVSFLEEMKSNPKLPKPNQYSYSAAIKACARLKDHRTALRLLEETRSDHCNTENVIKDSRLKGSDATVAPPNTWVYNAALLSLNNNKRNTRKQMTKRWRNKHIEKNWNKRNKEMNQKERTNVAMRLLFQMKNDHQQYNWSTRPDTITYNTILSVGSFPHQYEMNESVNETEHVSTPIIDALSLIDQMKLEGIPRDTTTYCNAIDSSIDSKDLMDILTTFLNDSSFLHRKSQKSRRDAMATIFNTCLYALTARRDFTKFKRALELMFENEIPINDETLSVVIYAIGENERELSLVNFIQLMEKIEGHHSNTDPSFDELFESIELFEDNRAIYKMPRLSDYHYTQAINIYLRENNFTNAYTILSRMRAKGISPSTSCMEGFALAYAQSAMDVSSQEKIRTKPNIENAADMSLSRASSAYKISMALRRPRPSTLGKVARACAQTGQWKLCRALLRSIHNNLLTTEEGEASIVINSQLLQTIRGIHSNILRECAKQGSVYAALHYTNDIQEFSKQFREKIKTGGQTVERRSKFADHLSDEDDIFQNLRSITDIPSSKANIGMQPNDWMSVIQAASKSGHWRVCFNTLQFLRPYVEKTKLKNRNDEDDNTNDERYNQLTFALYTVMRSLESHLQDAWAVRVIEDWIEWSGRQPRIESTLSAIRVLSAKGRVEEIWNVINICLQDNLSTSILRNKSMSYSELLYVNTVTALHTNGLYDDADEFFVNGIEGRILPFNYFRENGQFVLDLHGLNVALAHSAVRIAMRQQAATLAEEGAPQCNMMIITGKGRNSEFHLRPILRPEVQRMLLEEFYPPLNTISVPGNTGALTINAEDIEAWQQQQRQQKGIRMLKLAAVLKNLSSQERLKRIISLKLESENNEID